jgi:fucose permease
LIVITVLLIGIFAYIFSRYEDANFIEEFITNKGKDYLGLYLSLATLLVVVVGLLFANKSAQKNAEGWGAMKYPQLVWGMLALFTYVGVEVTIGSNLGELLATPDFGSISGSALAPFMSINVFDLCLKISIFTWVFFKKELNHNMIIHIIVAQNLLKKIVSKEIYYLYKLPCPTAV